MQYSKTQTTEKIELELNKIVHDIVVDGVMQDRIINKDLHELQFIVRYNMENMNYLIRSEAYIPCQKFHNKIIDNIPLTWWDHLKKDLGFKNYKKKQINMEQHIIYPNIPIPTNGEKIFTYYILPQITER